VELSNTAYVILGLLRSAPRSGYEIKQVVDKSTRFFWATSYGQIYPELKRLAAAGMVDAAEAPRGGRRRTVYRLTAAGRKELRRWLERDPETFELRDEGLLKLFFSAGGGPEAPLGAIAAKRRQHAATLDQLREIEPAVRAFDDPHPHVVLRYGIELNEWMLAWCDRATGELERGRRKAA